jgi:hypothetical protein
MPFVFSWSSFRPLSFHDGTKELSRLSAKKYREIEKTKTERDRDRVSIQQKRQQQSAQPPSDDDVIASLFCPWSIILENENERERARTECLRKKMAQHLFEQTQ